MKPMDASVKELTERIEVLEDIVELLGMILQVQYDSQLTELLSRLDRATKLLERQKSKR